MLANDQSLATGLLAFNIGLEAGQLVIVTLILLLAWFAMHVLKLQRREWVIFLSAAVFSLAFQMAAERFP